MATSVPDDIYWIVSFNTPTMANGITSKFKTFLVAHQILLPISSRQYNPITDYVCALSEGTDTTAISRKRLDEVSKNQGAIVLGKKTADGWIVAELNIKHIDKDLKAKGSADATRQNINEKYALLNGAMLYSEDGTPKGAYKP